MSQTTSGEQLIELLSYVLSGNNQKIQDATKYLKVYTKKVESVGQLALILSGNDNAQYRQLSAVLLKRNMFKLFGELDSAAQEQLKQILLQRFFDEQVNVIRTNVGQIIGVIAQQTLSENKWSQLYTILQQQTAKNQDLATRQKGLQLLSLIFDYSGDSLKPFYSVFYPFFVENLLDSDKLIRVHTVKCLISLFDNIQYMEKSEAQQYKTLVEPILKFVDVCIGEGDEDNAYHCFDAFSYLADQKLTILDNHLGMIIQYAAGPNILLNKKLSSRFKECVIDFIYSVIEVHRKILQKNQPLLKQLVETICLVISEPIDVHDLGEDEEPIQDIALWLVETLCITILKKKPLFGLFLQAITALIESGDCNRMNAGYLILAGITEGLQDQVRRSLQNPIMNVLIPKGLSDQRVEVRGGAIKALAYFSEWLCPEILIYDDVVLPQMIKNLTETDPRISEKGLMTIDIFAENMEADKIKPYLPTLIPALIQTFLQQTTTYVAKRLCLSSIGSIVTSAGLEFAPYLKSVTELLLKIVEEKDIPEIMGIKAETIQVLGKVADTFKDNQEVQTVLVNPLAQRVFQMLHQHNDFEIRESCLAFFYNMASAQGEAFAPVFDQLIEFTLKLAQSTEGISYEKKKQAGEFSLDTDSDSEDEQPDNKNMRVKVTQLDEKAAAIHALGQFALAVPSKFGPYFKTVFDILEETVVYFYENIRIQSVQCYCDLIQATIMHYNQGKLPTYTAGLPCPQRFNPEFETLLQTDLFQKFFFVIQEDDSVEVVALAIDAINSLAVKLGPAFVDGNLNELTKIILNVLEKKTKCQGASIDDDGEFEGEDEEEIDDEDDMNENIMENLTDLIPTLAKVLKQGFLLPFQTLLPSLTKSLHPDRDINEIIQAVGCFAQIFEYEPSTIPICQQFVVPFLIKAPTLMDVELNRNAVYCLATFCEYGPANDVQQALPEILSVLNRVYTECTVYQEAVDNAAAALCRILIRFPNALPLPPALDTILKVLPFKGDFEENYTAIRFLLNLGNTQPDLIAPHMALVIQLLLNALVEKERYKLKADHLIVVQGALKSLANNAQYKSLIEQHVFSIQDEQQRAKLIQQLQ